MKKIICFGEALIDFLNTGATESDGLSLNDFRQYPGGAPANAAVACAKLGASAIFLGQVGDDLFGHFLKNCLVRYGVNVDYLQFHPSAKTALAFVVLDDSGERSFSFHRHETADLVFDANLVPDSLFSKDDVFHFCSNTLTDSNSELTTATIVDKAIEKGCLISFDVNLRHNLWAGNEVDRATVNKFVARANVLKFSKEEAEFLCSGSFESYVEPLLDNHTHLAVVTDGGNALRYFGRGFQGELKTPKVSVVDTTAGGDAFSGGLIHALSESEDWQSLCRNEEQLLQAIKFAVACGAHAVSKPGAFPALPSINDVKVHLPKK